MRNRYGLERVSPVVTGQDQRTATSTSTEERDRA